MSGLRISAAKAWVAALLLLSLPVASIAQEITGSVRGTVTDPTGAPEAGAVVTITDTRTGTTRATETDANGNFSVRSLTIGGPYTIRIVSDDFQGTQITDVFTSLSAASVFNVQLEGRETAIEEIVVTSAAVQSAPMAIGPGSAFSLEEIQSLPSISRQIRDVIRVDPRVAIGRSAGGTGSGVNCLGGAPRTNAFTIDGSLAVDGYGLNEGTGTGARFSFPVPFDTVSAASVEFAPLDVQYSQFTGCAINIVTRGGSNEFGGSAFYLYNDDSLTGSSLDGERVITDSFEDKNFGFNFSGPIIKDKLFFFVAYEETDDAEAWAQGPIGAGFANEEFLTVGEADQIRDILIDQYDRDPGRIVRSLPQTTERIFARLDWNINDRHRAEMTYTTLDEQNIDEDDYGFGGFTFSDNFEIEGIEQDTISLRLFSDWTDTFSTEFRYSKFDVLDIQGPVGGGEAQFDDIARIQVEDGAGDTIFTSGPGFFRSSNDLDYEIEQIRLVADYVVGDHTLTFGVERESRDIFNLFIANATGTLTFGSIADLELGQAAEANFNGTFSGDPFDAAAEFSRDITSFYVQDEWQLTDAVTLIAGLRYDEYSSDDRPPENPRFEERYGFSNQQTFDGLDLVQPRIGLRWNLPDSSFGSTQLSLGYGVFGGGDPTVHFANSYQNFGGAIGDAFAQNDVADSGDCTPAELNVLAGGSFAGIPDCLRDAAAAAAATNSGAVAAVSPDFELPENQRWNIGLNHQLTSDIGFFDGWEIQADYIYTDHKNAVDWVDLRLTPNGVTLPDGRPQLFEVDPTLPDCNATFNGIGQGFSNAGGPGGDCDDSRSENQDVVMYNGVEGSTTSISLQLNKNFQFSDRTSLDVNFGYAYVDAEIGNPVNSSTPSSSYEETAVAVPGRVTLAPALWAIEHNFVLRMNLQHYFFDEYPTTFGMFFQRRSGNPFSYAWEDDTVEEYFGDSDDEERILLTVPTGPDDPRFNFSELGAEDTAALFAFLDRTGLSRYAGGIAPRNAFNAPWASDLDIRISQEMPLPWLDHSLQVFLDVENVLNLFGDDNNLRRFTQQDGDVEETVRVLEINERNAAAIGNTDQFVITRFYDDVQDIDINDSLYRIQLGVRYNF